MLPEKAWKSYVRNNRKLMPKTNNGRAVKVLDGTTKRGQDIAQRAWHCEGFSLIGIYHKPSPSKQYFYDEVYQMYKNDEGENFHICSYNSFQFTVAWDNPGEVVYITRDTEYHVLINN